MTTTMNHADSTIALAEAKLLTGIFIGSGMLKRMAPGFGNMPATYYVSAGDGIDDFIGKLSDFNVGNAVIAGCDIVAVSTGGDDESVIHLEFLNVIRCDGNPIAAISAKPINERSSLSKLLKSMGQSMIFSYKDSVWRISYLGRVAVEIGEGDIGGSSAD